MIKVVKQDKKYPFSRGILARALTRAGLSIEGSYEIVEKIKKELKDKEQTEIKSEVLVKKVSEELLQRNRVVEEKYFRVRRQIKYLDSSVFIMIGGSSGVGKSTISSAIGHKLGINRVIGTDTIREIMRSMLSEDLIPALHKSSFYAGESLKTTYVTNKLIYGFLQQVGIVTEGIKSVMMRGVKEGLNMVINGVHVVPGFIENTAKNQNNILFKYILDVPDVDSHIRNFYNREEESLRDPNRYISKIKSIRKIQEYLNKTAKKQEVEVIKNKNYNETIKFILNDIIKRIDKLNEEV